MLSTYQLTAGYGAVPVLFDVEIEIRASESVAIIGANGAGKSTLVRTICGLLPTMAGCIEKEGRSIETLAAHGRAGLGIAVVLEGRHLFGELSLESNLRIAEAQGRKRKDVRFDFSFDDVLDLFPFMRARLDAPVGVFSGGEQQMVAIGRALLLKPDLLILDEPSTGLAPKVVREIVQVIQGLRRRGMSLLIIEQHVGVAAECSDRAYVLALGRVVDQLEPDRWHNRATTDDLAKAYLGG
ncbi:ABC transporter ATP-binding protein [Bosea sp. (in: a-proteobacteria)]|jgi:ABC-type branched-subunit amino acid transport system ATPase component|uniref:ABC transporter ATP-binding protein n=1 Tax=Bosea sp. (in: a-proteobacteria) TaxID=1871050 RepID=UPI002DDDBC90|nr:ATP-binding cassette domain-containing protein [Bosea sp. (in: a-proteobacteria)]HEV2510323.1 ATP-binding cassette domain-containing protein [Bosea sp. (in: a-proteobacteria)]